MAHTHFMVTASLKTVLLMCLVMFTIFGLGVLLMLHLIDVHSIQMVKLCFSMVKLIQI